MLRDGALGDIRQQRRTTAYLIEPGPAFGEHYGEARSESQYEKRFVRDDAGTMDQTRPSIDDRVSEIPLLNEY